VGNKPTFGTAVLSQALHTGPRFAGRATKDVSDYKWQNQREYHAAYGSQLARISVTHGRMSWFIQMHRRLKFGQQNVELLEEPRINFGGLVNVIMIVRIKGGC